MNQKRKMVSISSTYNEKEKFLLYSGDCLELFRQIPDNSARLIVTSPPYNLGKEYETRQPLKDYLDSFEELIRECVRILHPRGSLCWQVGTYVRSGQIFPLDALFYPLFKKHGFKLKNRIIWHFETGLNCFKRLSGRHETVLWFTKSNDYVFNLDAIRVPRKAARKKYTQGEKKGQLMGSPLGKNPGDVWLIPKSQIEHTTHPCPYPVALIERLILAFTNPGDLVVDPYLGSGTTAVAALLHNRRCAGAERVPKYIQIIKDRLQQLEKGTLKYKPLDSITSLNQRKAA